MSYDPMQPRDDHGRWSAGSKAGDSLRYKLSQLVSQRGGLIGMHLHPDDRAKALAMVPLRPTLENLKNPGVAEGLKHWVGPVIAESIWMSFTFFKVHRNGRLNDKIRPETRWPRDFGNPRFIR